MSNQTMTIEDLIKAGKMESSVEFPLKRYVVVNIVFLIMKMQKKKHSLRWDMTR